MTPDDPARLESAQNGRQVLVAELHFAFRAEDHGRDINPFQQFPEPALTGQMRDCSVRIRSSSAAALRGEDGDNCTR